MVEYLWLFSVNNNYGNAVVSRSLEENERTFSYHMQQAKLARNYSGQCDTVSLYNIDYSLDKNTGAIIKTVTLMRQLAARRNGARILLCS